MRIYQTMIAAAGVALATTAAHASTVSFDLSCGGGIACTDRVLSGPADYDALSNTLVDTQGGLTLTVTARYFDLNPSLRRNTIGNADIRDAAKLSHFAEGAGVVTKAYGDVAIFEGNGRRNDIMEFAFSEAVTLNALKFAAFDGGDDFRFIYDSNMDGEIGNGDFMSDEIVVDSSIAGPNGVASNLWAVATFKNTDSFMISGLTVETLEQDVSSVAPVPIPATGVLLLGALGGLAAMRRKQRG